jgi:hypothetical protein
MEIVNIPTDYVWKIFMYKYYKMSELQKFDVMSCKFNTIRDCTGGK